jgi:ubiquinone/menaquinone biosynthesis C-methylase UbiE
MMYMKSLTLSCFFLIGLGIQAIAQHHPHDHSHDPSHCHSKPDSTKTANEYMHQSSTEALIRRFESPERDAYQKPEEVIQYLGKIKGRTIMDIGTGSGYFAGKLARKGARVIAADVNEEFLEHVEKRIAAEKLQNITTRKIPYESPGLTPAEVDMVLIVNTYHHIEHRSAYFRQVKQGLKPQGELVVIDYFKTELPVGPPVHHKIGLDEVVSELKQAGFRKFEVEINLLPYQYILKAR